MIYFERVSKYYGAVRAVDDISFEVKEGQTVALLGTSGCGKTTTLRMVNRLQQPTAGRITVNGVHIQQQNPQQLRRGIGYVLQHTGLFPHYTIEQNIGTVPRLLGWQPAAIQERTHQLLYKLHLDPPRFAHLYPHQLSGGQQQRVGLARALAANPPVLLMDEPFGALDPVTRHGIRTEFKELDELRRKTVLMVTHDVDEAFELADNICLMDKGRIVQMGTPLQLLFEPASSFVSGFFNNQRFLLELKAVTLGHIAPYLPENNQQQAHLVFDNNTTLFTAVESLSKQQDAIATIHNMHTRPLVTMQCVMDAFATFKSRYNA